MKAKDFIWLDQQENIGKLLAKGYRYIIPGDEYTEQDLGLMGYSDILFLEAVPVEVKPEDPVAFKKLSVDVLADDVYSYIVDPKYFA